MNRNWYPGLVSAVAIGTVAVCAWSASRSHADSFVGSPSYDFALLSADEIDFATVEHLEIASDDAESCDVTLSRVSTVFSRWSGYKTHGIRVKARLNEDSDGVLQADVAHVASLVVGQRYLFLLRGGSWQVAPFSVFGVARVSEEGFMTCAGGEVFGLSPFGLICSTREAEVSAPLTESELAVSLARSRSNARARRADFAAEQDRNAQPLTLIRDSSGAR